MSESVYDIIQASKIVAEAPENMLEAEFIDNSPQTIETDIFDCLFLVTKSRIHIYKYSNKAHIIF